MLRHEELVKLLEEMGASFTGFANVEGKLNGNFQNLHYAVTVGLLLSDAIIDGITDKPTFTYFHHYRTVNALLDQIALRGLLYIQQHGFNAVAVPASQTVNDAAEPFSGIFPHKTAAVLAGLGRIGKNDLFIHNTYGPRVRLATILTDAELPYTRPIQMRSCLSCNKCVDACPAMALTGSEWYEGAAREVIVDVKACSDYMNKNFKHIGRGSVCGICIKVCPAHGNIER